MATWSYPDLANEARVEVPLVFRRDGPAST
jgi:hypothetical protein